MPTGLLGIFSSLNFASLLTADLHFMSEIFFLQEHKNLGSAIFGNKMTYAKGKTTGTENKSAVGNVGIGCMGELQRHKGVLRRMMEPSVLMIEMITLLHTFIKTHSIMF